MKKKAVMLLVSSSGIFIVIAVVLIACMLTLGFFGENIIGDTEDGLTDPYVEYNAIYVGDYLPLVARKLKEGKGYVSLSRIVFFYTENDKLTFEEIYDDNLNEELKQVKPISAVCKMEKYKNTFGCTPFELQKTNQIDKIQSKPFARPIDFNIATATSFFMEQRIVYGKSNVHKAWDLAAPNQTPVYSVCDGVVRQRSFRYTQNVIDTSDNSGGNYITIECKIDKSTYSVFYAHLYPDSYLVKEGDLVYKGQEIASVGTTGYSTGPHLHFQVSRNGTVVDGMSLINFLDIE